MKHKYPYLEKALLTRHTLYNETIKYCEQLEKEGKAIILRPSLEKQIDSFEKDLTKIDSLYQYGYDETVKRIQDIKELMK